MVEAVQAMRGVAFIVAVPVVAEVGDFHRFDTPPADDGLCGAHTIRAFQRRQPSFSSLSTGL